MKHWLGLIIILLLCSCAQAPTSPSTQLVEVTRIVSQNVEVTRIVEQTVEKTVLITQIKTLIITATPKPATVIPSPTNTFGPTNTQAPTETPIPPHVLTQTAQASLDAQLRLDHDPGFYLVNVDIAPGIWRSTPGQDDCYWKRSDKTGDIIDNYYGFSGVTMYVAPSDFAVEMTKECGTWTWLSAP